MISMRWAVLLPPVYAVAMTAVSMPCCSGSFDTQTDLLWWLIISCTVTAVVVFCMTAWSVMPKTVHDRALVFMKTGTVIDDSHAGARE